MTYLLVFGGMGLASAVLALLPWRPWRARVAVLGLHVGGTVAAILLLPGDVAAWVVILAPGGVIALVRLYDAVRYQRPSG